jgi:Uma2 family endonuclease
MPVETAFFSEEVFTPDEFLRWVDERPASDANRYELLRGRIVMSPPARWPHGRCAARLVAALEVFVRPRGLGIVLDGSTGLALPSGDTVEPDVSFVSAARLAAGPTPVDGELLRIVPDLVIEILSPSTRARDLGEKRELYESNGVREYWVVDSRERTVRVFRRGRQGFATERVVAEGSLESDLIPGLSISLADVFTD